MQFVFVHGWGFDAGIWAGIRRELEPALSGHEAVLVELGFLGGDRTGEIEITPDSIVIGHSLGVLWLLKQAREKPRALVSLCGFPRFSPPVPRRQLQAMQQGLERNVFAQMKQFWRLCGIPPYARAEALDRVRLLEGLDWLMQWEANGALDELDCPVLALAARDDAVVNAAMTRAIWPDNRIDWAEDGGHALPLTRPAWCAQRIGQLLERL